MTHRAPSFSLLNQDNTSISLDDFLEKKVILYFYPKAMTSGCTKQALLFKEHYTKLQAAGYEVLGVSPDAPALLKRFQDTHELPFHLLSDPDHKTCEDYGVWKEKSMYGRTYMGVERSTFLIDDKQMIAHETRKVQVGKQWSILDKEIFK